MCSPIYAMLKCVDLPDFLKVPAGSSIFMKLRRNACRTILLGFFTRILGDGLPAFHRFRPKFWWWFALVVYDEVCFIVTSRSFTRDRESS